MIFYILKSTSVAFYKNYCKTHQSCYNNSRLFKRCVSMYLIIIFSLRQISKPLKTRLMKIPVTIGTRPEVIKMEPIVKRLKCIPTIETKVCNTGQHKNLVDPILDFFRFRVPYPTVYMGRNTPCWPTNLHWITAHLKSLT